MKAAGGAGLQQGQRDERNPLRPIGDPLRVAATGALNIFNTHVTLCWEECKTHLVEYCAGCGKIMEAGEAGWAPLSIMWR